MNRDFCKRLLRQMFCEYAEYPSTELLARIRELNDALYPPEPKPLPWWYGL